RYAVVWRAMHNPRGTYQNLPGTHAQSAAQFTAPYGFCKEGEALDFIQDGRIELDGELPLNTFGGSLGTGRIHGHRGIIEGCLAGLGPRRFTPSRGRQRVVRRRQRPDRDRHDLYLRARALLTKRKPVNGPAGYRTG